MKQFKKVLAIILAICTAFSAMAISVSAEDTADSKNVIEYTLTGATATKFAEDDAKKVLQIEMTFDLDEEECEFTYDTFNENAEILIVDYYLTQLYIDAGYTTGSDGRMQELLDRYVLAKAKPVSFEEGVLTLDVLSLNGDEGATLVKYIETKDIDPIDHFFFAIPEGLFADSETEDTSDSLICAMPLEGELFTVELKISKLFYNIITKIYESGSAFLMVLVFPLLMIAMPIINAKYQKVYDLYGIDVDKEVRSAYLFMFGLLKR